MKKITLFFNLFLFCLFSSYAQVQIGAGTNTDQKLPFYPAFEYSYTQSIYLASEINAAGQITAIKWFYSGSSTLPNSQDLKIYIGNTSKTVFSSDSNWEPIGNLTLVYTGKFPIVGSKSEWKTVTLDTPFNYNGTSNLIVATNEYHIDSDGFGDRFYNSAVSGNRSLAFWGGVPINITNPPKAEYTGGFSAFVPNITFVGLTQSCPNALGLSISNIDETSATLNWLANSPTPALGTQYYYSTSSTEPNASTEPIGEVPSGITANISSLLPATKYYAWVRNHCSTNEFSAWSAVASFITECEGVDYVFENFDQVTSPNLPNCWSKIIKNANQYAVVSTFEAEYVVSPKNIVELYDAGADGDIMLVSPQISDLKDALSRLKVYLKGNANDVIVGTLDKNNNTGTFTPYQTVSITKLWKQYTIDFNGYRGTDKYIAIKLVRNLSEDKTFVDIDNFLYETTPLCVDSKGLRVVDSTPTSALLNWDQVGAAQYQIVYGVTNATFPTDLSPLTPVSVLAQTLADLTPNTTYKVWLRSVCAENDFSTWSEPILFTTPCIAQLDNGFYENFNTAVVPNLPNCWSKIIRGTSPSPFSTVDTSNYGDILPQPNTNVTLYNFDNNVTTNDVMLVSPKLSTLQLGTYRLRFIAKHKEFPAGIEIGTLNNNTDYATFKVIQTNQLTSNTKEYVVNFDNTELIGEDTFIAIRLKASQQFCSAELDNIIWELSPSCADVQDIKVDNATANSVTVSWVDGSSSQSFDVAVVDPNNTDPTSFTFKNSITSPTTIENLNASTTYSVWVRSVCPDNDKGNWMGPINFSTPCTQVAVFNETFQSVSTPNLPACWTKILRGPTLPPNARIETQISLLPTFTKAVLISNLDTRSGDDVILVTPSLSTLYTGAYRLRFKAKGSDGGGTIEFVTLPSNLEDAVYTTTGKSIIPATIATEYTVDFDGEYGENTYVGIRAASPYTYVELDNIVWEQIPVCNDVTGVTVDETTTTTATVYWAAGTATKWEVAYGDLNETNPNSENVTVVTTDIPAIVIDNLSIGTCYNVWVRNVCSEDVGTWTTPVELCTQCNATNVPYIQDFESATPPKLPLCTSAVNISEGSANWFVENNPGYGFNSNTLTYLSPTDNNDADAWFFTQGVNLESGKEYTISYRYGGASTDDFYYNNSMKVMYGKGANPFSMTLRLADYPNFSLDAPVAQSINFTPTTTDVYYFGFNVYSPNNSYYMFIDDIIVDNKLSNNNFDISKFNYYPNPVKDVLNISYINNITAVSIYNLIGQEIVTKIVNDNLTKVDMSGLAKGTYMVKVTSDNLIKTIKIIKQ